jgi:hypothetical protein
VLDPDGKNIEAVLRRRSQFTPEPARCRARLHRIDKLDHSLMNVFTSGALECLDVKAGRAGGVPRQHRHRFALRACWSVKRAHDVVPYIRREHKTLNHRIDARDGPVMGNSLPRTRPDILVNTDHFSEKLTNCPMGRKQAITYFSSK